MSDQVPSGDSASLQFDRAIPLHDAAPIDRGCVRCQAKVAESYYVGLDGDYCRDCMTLAQSSGVEPGLSDLMKAVLFGTGAALAGTVAYFAVLALTGYEIGFLAIAVGWFVGKAVARGGRGLGGWKLQTMAVVLTYCSLVGSYVPLIIKEGMAQQQKKDAAEASASSQSKNAAPAAADPGTSDSSLAGTLFFALFMLFLFALATPFLAGFQNILGLVMIAFGLFQAWKMNVRVRPSFTGPFGAPTTAAATAAEAGRG